MSFASIACIGFCDFVDGLECKIKFAQNGAFGVFLSISKNPAPHPERGLNFHKMGWLVGYQTKVGPVAWKVQILPGFMHGPGESEPQVLDPGCWIIETQQAMLSSADNNVNRLFCARFGVASFKSQARQTLHGCNTYEGLQQFGSQVVHTIVVGPTSSPPS